MTNRQAAGIKIGSKVKGSYYDVPFTGTVRELESDTMDWNHVRAYINLDSPIVVWGVSREGCMIDGENGQVEVA